MSCSQCRVFHGNPVCGACRAAGRVWGILKSGKLPAAEEEKVTLLLRGVAGELSDLLEGALPGRAPTPPLEEADRGEHRPRPPGLKEVPKSRQKTLLHRAVIPTQRKLRRKNLFKNHRKRAQHPREKRRGRQRLLEGPRSHRRKQRKRRNPTKV